MVKFYFLHKIHVYVVHGSFHERKSKCVKKSILNVTKYMLFFSWIVHYVLRSGVILLAEKEEKTIQGSKVESLKKKCSTSELPNRNKQNGSPERSKEMWVAFPPRMPNENEVMS